MGETSRKPRGKVDLNPTRKGEQAGQVVVQTLV